MRRTSVYRREVRNETSFSPFCGFGPCNAVYRRFACAGPAQGRRRRLARWRWLARWRRLARWIRPRMGLARRALGILGSRGGDWCAILSLPVLPLSVPVSLLLWRSLGGYSLERHYLGRHPWTITARLGRAMTASPIRAMTARPIRTMTARPVRARC